MYFKCKALNDALDFKKMGQQVCSITSTASVGFGPSSTFFFFLVKCKLWKKKQEHRTRNVFERVVLDRNLPNILEHRIELSVTKSDRALAHEYELIEIWHTPLPRI